MNADNFYFFPITLQILWQEGIWTVKVSQHITRKRAFSSLTGQPFYCSIFI